MRYIGFSIVVLAVVIALFIALQVGTEDANIFEESVNVIDKAKDVREQIRNQDASLENVLEE